MSDSVLIFFHVNFKPSEHFHLLSENIFVCKHNLLSPLNPFRSDVTLVKPLKTFENRTVSDGRKFREHRIVTMGTSRLM